MPQASEHGSSLDKRVPSSPSLALDAASRSLLHAAARPYFRHRQPSSALGTGGAVQLVRWPRPSRRLAATAALPAMCFTGKVRRRLLSSTSSCCSPLSSANRCAHAGPPFDQSAFRVAGDRSPLAARSLCRSTYCRRPRPDINFCRNLQLHPHGEQISPPPPRLPPQPGRGGAFRRVLLLLAPHAAPLAARPRPSIGTWKPLALALRSIGRRAPRCRGSFR